ncbi:hypothetical protein PBI_MINERVA_29 [Mycobacterium phage Minerva]|nr:hypothetical protein VC71_gp029 [Mycobacterium phage Minerva]AIK69238.1 hypothetical protein PBI_MINERVA_29 [Mycobacterium phage Minerva]
MPPSAASGRGGLDLSAQWALSPPNTRTAVLVLDDRIVKDALSKEI